MDKINYEPVIKTGVLSSSIYDGGNVITLGGKTHMALIENSEHKFAALEVLSAVDKDGNPCILQEQACDDGNFAVLAISALKAKRVYSSEQVTSNKRLSGGMNVSEILALEAGIKYRLKKTPDGFKKPFGWQEGEPLQQNNSYRLEKVVIENPQPTTQE